LLGPATVADLTERELIARIKERLPAAPNWLLIGIGDDAAVVEPERNRVEVLTVDALVEGVHFDRAFVPADAIGHRALAVNLSDLAAMGAAPRLALLSLALPPALPLAEFDAMVGGFAALAVRHRLHVAGGNLTRSPGPMMIDVTVIGTVKRRQALTRGGARPGDELYVSGTIGAAAAGLRILREGLTAEDAEDAEGKARLVHVPGFSSASSASSAVKNSGLEACVQRYLRPEPRVRLGLLLARNRAARACMDLSDGLSDALYQMTEASGVGAIVDADALPIEPGAREYFAARGFDAVAESMTGGDDYELLAAVHPRTRRRLAAAVRHGDAPLTRIGVCTQERAIVLRHGKSEAPLVRGGYSHFGGGALARPQHA
jgi:thiamine-monophosphate kinase